MLSSFFSQTLTEYYQKSGITANTFNENVFYQTINFNNLQNDIKHYGCCVKLISEFSFRLDQLQMIKCKSQGKDVMVSIENFPFDKIQPFYQGRVFYINNPCWINEDNGYIILLKDLSQIDLVKKQIKSLEQYRQEGKKLIQNNQIVNAYYLYHQAIEQIKEAANQQILLLNMAIVCFKLNLKEEYGQNIRKVLNINPNSEKGHYHLIKHQTISMNDCHDQHKFQRLIQKVQNNKFLGVNTKIQLVTFILFNETFQRNKKINWKQAILSQNLGQYFSPKLEERATKHGRGLFAKENIAQGQIIIIERPIISYLHEEKWSMVKNSIISFRDYLIELLNLSKEFKSKFMNLYSPQNYKNSQEIDIKYIEGILKCNIFIDFPLKDFFNLNPKLSISTVRPKYLNMLYQKICLINHECQSNCQRAYLGSSCIIYANTDINAGQEITVSYVMELDYNKRIQLFKNWGIKCNCILCIEQKALIQGKKIDNPKSNYLQINKLTTKTGNFLGKLKEYVKNNFTLEIIGIGFQNFKVGIENDAINNFLKIFPMTKKQFTEVLKACK